MASHGHASTQRPHTTQRSSSISKIAGRFSMPFDSLSSGTIVMQCAGHTVGQHMHAAHRAVLAEHQAMQAAEALRVLHLLLRILHGLDVVLPGLLGGRAALAEI